MAKEHPEREAGLGARQRTPHAGGSLDARAVQALLAEWPQAPRTGAEQMIRQYGLPDEATPTRLFWHRNEPWKRTVVSREVVEHNFPAPHGDYLTQVIDYRIPPEIVDEVALFDGSCLVDRTSGEVAARCDSEAANFITLNLMHEIVEGRRTVDEARKAHVQAMADCARGRSSPYAEGLLFEPAQGGTADPDQAMLAGAASRPVGRQTTDADGPSRPPEDRATSASALLAHANRSPAFPYEKSQ